MTEHSFSLIPFPDANSPDIKIAGKISRQNNTLAVYYSLSGNVGNILFPEISQQPKRKDELWTATCFEFFLAIPEQPQYWEFNMSPSGDWNIYHIDTYRRLGFREERRIQRLPFSVRKEAGCVSIEVSVDLSRIVRAQEPIQTGITSIIQTNDGLESYWALAHPNPQADFHLRESFTLELAG
jgi:hypothetical protein